MKFDHPANARADTRAPAPAPALTLEVQPYDIDADKRAVVARLAGSDEIEALTATIDVNDMTTIVNFGSDTAREISKASDAILRSMDLSQLDASGRMLEDLAGIMDRFNVDELRDNPTLLGKLFGNARRQLDRILEKYHTMGDEVDRIYVQLRQYEAQIDQSNRMLEEMFQANVGYFHELEKYIVAGEQGCREIEAYMAERTAQMEKTGDQSITFELQTLSQALNMLEQRTQDLRIAETVALQSIPMIRTIQFSNLNLIRKINSAFIVTLPVFRQALAQAIMLKRQKIQADAMAALDKRTNEMLLKNAKSTMDQAKQTARMVAGSSISADTLKSTWNTITAGIEETRRIQASSRERRMEDQARLEALKRDFAAKTNPARR
ncbi:MAG: toxic anion resistance protein [Clostridia bacterium]|nr:toxic anion resistance protein [Clostridia bacterium]